MYYCKLVFTVATNGVVIAAEKKHKSVLYDEKTITKVITCTCTYCVFCVASVCHVCAYVINVRMCINYSNRT